MPFLVEEDHEDILKFDTLPLDDPKPINWYDRYLIHTPDNFTLKGTRKWATLTHMLSDQQGPVRDTALAAGIATPGQRRNYLTPRLIRQYFGERQCLVARNFGKYGGDDARMSRDKSKEIVLVPFEMSSTSTAVAAAAAVAVIEPEPPAASPYNFNGHPVRIVDQDGEPWFVARDVAGILGYADTDDAIRRHCKNTQTYTGETPGQVRSIRIIPESDVNRLMMRSNKEEALVFQDWLAEEVLPSIRKTGGYRVDIRSPTLVILDTVRDVVVEQERVSAVVEEQQLDIEQLQQTVADIGATSGYCSIMGYGNRIGRVFSTKDASTHGKAVSKLCRARGEAIQKTHNEVYGYVNTYPLHILETHFGVNAVG